MARDESAPLSPNARAIALLTQPLGRAGVKPMTPKGYAQLAKSLLLNTELSPGQLRDRPGAIRSLLPKASGEMALRLLADEDALDACLAQWAEQGIWLMTRACPDYPRRALGARPQPAPPPPVLYGKGERGRLKDGGLAIVGSRDLGPDAQEVAREAGRAAAVAGVPVVSGGARGADRIGVGAALRRGGTATVVLWGRLALEPSGDLHDKGLSEGRVTLVSPQPPEAGWSISAAFGRNHQIYGLADVALVVNALDGSGGSWAGAKAQIENGRTPVYVRSHGRERAGADALARMGASLWPRDCEAEDVTRLIKTARQADARRGASAEASPSPRGLFP